MTLKRSVHSYMRVGRPVSLTAAVRARRVARDIVTLRRFASLARGGKPRRPLCLVYGNCQAEPIRVLLASSPEFAARYETIRIPAVHEINAVQLRMLERLLRSTSLLIAQPIKEGYRQMSLGLHEILRYTPPSCQVIRFPNLRYDALYPFQAAVLTGNWNAASVPVTVRYHDLRTLCAAARRFSVEAATRWLSDYQPPKAVLKDIGDESAARLRRRESRADIRVFDWLLTGPERHARSFFTHNHPARVVLDRIANSVISRLGLAGGTLGDAEPLGIWRTPLERPVVDALGLRCEARPDWIINGRPIVTIDLLQRHMNWYRRHPEIVQAAVNEHGERAAALGLL